MVLTGAGISTESGIPDFRSPSGIWARYDPMEYATIDAFLEDPAKVWDFYGKRLAMLDEAQPNDGHRALAELEDRGWVRAVITQNIDRLHEQAGSRALVEVHGSIRTSSCLDCGTVVPFAEVVELLPVPALSRLRADPEARRRDVRRASAGGAIARAPSSRRARACCSSSALRSRSIPVAGLPLETLAAGGSLAIVNRGSTPFDGRAAVTIDGGAGETLRALADALPERP